MIGVVLMVVLVGVVVLVLSIVVGTGGIGRVTLYVDVISDLYNLLVCSNIYK